jgi:hypothetical protein
MLIYLIKFESEGASLSVSGSGRYVLLIESYYIFISTYSKPLIIRESDNPNRNMKNAVHS